MNGTYNWLPVIGSPVIGFVSHFNAEKCIEAFTSLASSALAVAAYIRNSGTALETSIGPVEQAAANFLEEYGGPNSLPIAAAASFLVFFATVCSLELVLQVLLALGLAATTIFTLIHCFGG